MNRLSLALCAAVGATLTCQMANAQFANGDLVLGFTSANAVNDYILELGNYQSVVGVSGTAPVDLSSHFSLSEFNLDYSTGLNGVEMGVVGGNNAFSGSFIFETESRPSAGDPRIPGSTPPTDLAHSAGKNGLSEVQAMVNGLNLSADLSLSTPRGGTGVGSYSWFNYVSSPTPPTQSFFTQTGQNPDATAAGNVIYEDLWGTPATSSSGTYVFDYEGYFALDLSGARPSLTFTPASAVPEPSASVLLAGALALLGLRSRLSRRPRPAIGVGRLI